MKPQAAQYCRSLFDLLAQTQVTSREGVRMGLDRGSRQAVEMILSLAATSRKAFVVGNGGSAAIASHMVNDLCKAVRVRAMICNDISLLTALANDEGYPRVYEHHMQQWADPGDLLIAISSSGKSENILRAAAAAAERGCRVLTLSGFSADNPLRKTGDLNFYVQSGGYGFVELAHSVLTHFFTDAAAAARAGQPQKETSYDIPIQTADPGHRRGGLRRRRASA